MGKGHTTTFGKGSMGSVVTMEKGFNCRFGQDDN